MTCCNNCGGSLDAVPVSGTSCNCGCTPSQSCSPVVQSQGCNCSSPCLNPCLEDHTQCIQTYSFATTIRVVHAFNMPAVGATAQIKLDNVINVLPGTIIWNPSVGYLEVISYDTTTGYLLVKNNGEDGNKAEGSALPSCIEFVVTAPVSATLFSGSTTATPFLAGDFVAPANGNCTLMSVTTVTGLNVNDIVSISGFQYRISDILDANTIEVCNEGFGAPAGQVIKADANCDQVLDIPVLVISSDDPCTKDPVNSGVIVVCDDGVRKPFVGTQDGQVAIWDANQEKWVLINSNIIESCTILTACLTLDIGNIGPYVATVASTAVFNVGSIVVIGTTIFEVTHILNATQMRIEAQVVPGAIQIFDEGTQVCLQDCCAYLPQAVEDITDRLDDIEAPCWLPVSLADISGVNSNEELEDATTLNDLVAENDEERVETTINVGNTSLCRARSVHTVAIAEVNGNVTTGDDLRLEVQLTLSSSFINYNETTLRSKILGSTNNTNDVQVTEILNTVIPISSSITVTGEVIAKKTSASVGTYELDNIFINLASIDVID